MLRRLDGQTFDLLFHARGQRYHVSVTPEIGEALRLAGVAAGRDDMLFGLVRARRIEQRFYFLELDEGAQYYQDVWPETDALLAQLEGAAPGRFLDVGTGCGVIALEAAARGHSVVATDLYPKTIELARFNAALNGVDGIDFRCGHLFEPVAGERFDLILTAPHYGLIHDQLRLEVFAAGPAHLTPAGRLFLATTLEWEEGQPLGVEAVLRPLAESAAVQVTPIVSKALDWFSFYESGGTVPRLTSRHRFLVEVRAGGSGLAVIWPPPDSQLTKEVVPLSRLTKGGFAALVGGEDLERLRRTLAALAPAHAVVEEPIPWRLIDGCRIGERNCVGRRSAAGALLSLDGTVRPCTHGGPVARAGDGLRALEENLMRLAAEAEARRGCPTCPAQSMCSRCLFPAPFDEHAYCDFMRAHTELLPIYLRLCNLASDLGDLATPLEIDRWPRPRGATPAWPPLTVLWNEREAWLVRDGDRHTLWFVDGGREVDEQVAWLGRLVGDGADRAAIEGRVSPRRLRKLLERICDLVGADPAAVIDRTSD